jgi:HK97 family phage portal protein
MRSISVAEAIFGGIDASDPVATEGYWTSYTPGMTLAPTASAMYVDANTAMTISAVFRCVSILANTAALLPGSVYRRLERGREEVRDHPVRNVLWGRPNPYQTAFEFKRVMAAWTILRGASFAQIVTRPGVLELWPLHPDRVKGPEVLPGGRRRCIYTKPQTGEPVPMIVDHDIIAINGLSLDGVRGLAMSDLARESFGLAGATERYGAEMFARGARFSGAIRLPQGKTIANEETRKKLSNSIRMTGAGPGKWHGVPVLDDGMEWQNISMSNDDAQFLETRRFTVTDVARWFGVPPHMIGDLEKSTSWGTGIEEQTMGFLTYALLPWLVLFEQGFESAFLTEPDLYVKINPAGLLRANAQVRFGVYEIGIRNGIYSPNDCREFEELNPREGGDEYVTPTAPQQAAGSRPGPPSLTEGADGEKDEDDDKARAELMARVEAIEQRLAEPEPEPTRDDALRAMRASAEMLGVSKEALRKVLANARPKE